MGLDISKLTCAAKHMIKEYDKNENGYLENTEYNVFLSDIENKKSKELEKNNGVNGTYNNIFDDAAMNEIKEKYSTEDDFVTNPAKADKAEATTSEKTDKKQAKAEKQERERKEKVVKDHITSLANNSNTKIADILEILDTKLGKNKDDATYVEIKTNIASMIRYMNKNYNSVDEVDNSVPVIKYQMNNNPSIKANEKFYNNILEQLKKVAKNGVKTNTYNELQADYNKRFQGANKDAIENPGTRYAKTPEDILNEMKAELKSKGKFKGEVKKQFENLENTIKQESQAIALQAVAQATDKNLNESKEVKNDAMATLEEQGRLDKYTKKALGRSFKSKISGKKSDVNVACDIQARHNNVELHKKQSKENVLDALGNNSSLYEHLVNAGLIIENEDGTCDLTPLSTVIKENVGTDYRLNRDAKKDAAVAEKLNLRTALANEIKTELKGVSDKDAKKLAKLCGFDVEKKNYGKAVLNGVGAFLVGAAGAGGAAAAKNNDVLLKGGTVTNKTHVEINDIDSSKIGDLGEGVTVTNSGTGVIIDVIQIIKQPDVLLKLAKGIGMSALIGGITTALPDVIMSLMNDGGQVPRAAVNFDADTLEGYIEHVKTATPKSAPLLIAIAMKHYQDGKWDKAAFLKELNLAAGDHNSIMNREELLGLQLDNEKAPKPTKEEATEEETPEILVEEAEKEEFEEVKEKVKVEVPVENLKHTGWSQLAGQYSCLEEEFGSKAKAIRVLKLVQGITNNDYSKENIQKLLELSYNDKKALKDIAGFDYEAYNSALIATYLGDTKVPTNIAGCDRDNTVSLKVTGKVNTNGKKVAPGTPAQDYEERTTQKSKGTNWAIQVNNGKQEVFSSANEALSRKNQIKAQNPNAKVTIKKVTWDETKDGQ